MDFKEKARELVARMTMEEKASLCSGEDFWHLKAIDRLGLPSILVTDGPHGLRKQTESADQLGLNDSLPATCFPTASLTACSFDRKLLEDIGRAIGEECRQEDVAVVLGPGVNMKRSPLCGRNFEYFSEDPLLAGELAAAYINGVQSQNVGTSLKHFAANNQEKLRMTSESVADERTLREIYLTAFEIAVKKAQPWTVMCSYNKLRGEYASDSHWLLTDVLREEWGYENLVVSDWGAVNDRVAGVEAGMDVEMPAVSRENDKAVLSAVRSGALSEAELDRCAERVTELILRSMTRRSLTYDKAAHHALARKAAAQSAVLLKNDDGILPLKKGRSLAVIGELAENPRFQGAGSSKINPNHVDNVLEELRSAGFAFTYAEGYDLGKDAPDEKYISAACEAAKNKDVALVFAGLPDRYESEGFDRASLAMPESHIALIERVAQVNPNTVVVLQTGGVVECPWAESVKGILLQYLGGEASCGATVDLLSGVVCPSGKLAESWCEKLADTPAFGRYAENSRTAEYRESVFVGYRWYDTALIAPRWPFGFGLSYTSFEYSSLELDKLLLKDTDTLRVSCTVKNTGEREGSEIVQLYVAPRTDGIFRPAQELKGFEKVTLAPGQETRVSFSLDRRAFAYYNVLTHDWAVENGEYDIRISASSRDVRLSGRVTITAGKPVSAPDYHESAPCYYNLKNGLSVSDAEFQALYGGPLPRRHMRRGERYTINSTMQEIQRKWLGRLFARIIKKMAGSMLGDDPDTKLMAEAMMNEAPLRMLLMGGGETVSRRRLGGIVDMLNGHFFRGVAAVLKN